jgi:hypothetical protein
MHYVLCFGQEDMCQIYDYGLSLEGCAYHVMWNRNFFGSHGKGGGVPFQLTKCQCEQLHNLLKGL